MTSTLTDPVGCATRLWLRPATSSDASQVFAWRNLPEIIELGTLRRAVARHEHETWFAESLRGDKRRLFIIVCGDEPAGQLRYDWTGPREAEISLYLVPGFTGRGLGVQAIRQGCRQMQALGPIERIVAWVCEDNARSLAAFRKAGFEEKSGGPMRSGHRRLVWEISPRVPHNRLTCGAEEEAAVARVVRSGRWAGGTELAELESRLARVAGVAHAVGVGSGVGALRLSLLALGVGAGDRVAVPAYSCVALANAVLACGAEPVAVDVSPGTWNMSVASLRETLAVQPHLKAAIAVHTFGCPAPVRELEELGLPVVEDCSHAFGRRPLGALGRVAMLSLYATKLLGAGEGGVVLTDDSALAAQVRTARDYTDQAPTAHRLNDKLTDLEAALALCQLDRLPAMLARRAELARRYTSLLQSELGGGDISLPVDQPGRVWYRYTLAVPDADALIVRLDAAGITAVRPVESWHGDALAGLPVSAEACRRLVSLPLYPTLTESEQDLVCSAVVRAFSTACFT